MVIKRKSLLLIAITIFILICNQGVAQTQIKNLLGKEITAGLIESFLDKQMNELEVSGISVAIINEGEVVYHLAKGYSDIENKIKITSNSIFEGASLSKPMFAYLVMILVEEGKLDLDKCLYKYLPYKDIAHDERYKKITARMVLSHTTGFPNWRTDHEGGQLFISYEPGTAFQYSGEAYQYLAKVVARILETNDAGLEAFYQERVAEPLGLRYTKFLQDSENMKNKVRGYIEGKAVAEDDNPLEFGSAYSIHSEAKDFSKWLIALMNREVLSDLSYEELFKAQFALPDGHPQKEEGITDWALGFAKATLPFGSAYGHGGNNPGYTSLFMVAPDAKWGYIMFTNANQSQLPLVFLQYLMMP